MFTDDVVVSGSIFLFGLFMCALKDSVWCSVTSR